jgi:hypothetical protein
MSDFESSAPEEFGYVRAWFLFHAGYSLEWWRVENQNWMWVRDINNFSGRPHIRFRLIKK